MNGQFDFSKCRGLAIRGFNKMKLYSTVYSHVRDCEAFDPVLIIPKTVIDAVGTPDPDRGYLKLMFVFEAFLLMNILHHCIIDKI